MQGYRVADGVHRYCHTNVSAHSFKGCAKASGLPAEIFQITFFAHTKCYRFICCIDLDHHDGPTPQGISVSRFDHRAAIM